jgi:hypothetical protein
MNGPPLRSFARQADAGLVDGLQFVGKTERRKARPVGSESIGFENLSARIHVGPVNPADQIGSGQAQLVEAAVDEHTVPVEHGPHGPIGHQDAARQLLTKFQRARGSCSAHG